MQKAALPMLIAPSEINAARRKLREARFFLDRLRSRVKTFPLDPEEVACLLSAFLSAARSVSYTLRLGRQEHYDAWLPQWLAGISDEERAICQSMVACPDCGPSLDDASSLASDLIPFTDTRADRWGHPAYSFHWFQPNGADDTSDSFYVGGPVAEVCRNCERFILILERLVSDYDRAQATTGDEPS
jgi:hypothetical protein